MRAEPRRQENIAQTAFLPGSAQWHTGPVRTGRHCGERLQALLQALPAALGAENREKRGAEQNWRAEHGEEGLVFHLRPR
jgi:hypothetical protein